MKMKCKIKKLGRLKSSQATVARRVVLQKDVTVPHKSERNKVIGSWVERGMVPPEITGHPGEKME